MRRPLRARLGLVVRAAVSAALLGWVAHHLDGAQAMQLVARIGPVDALGAAGLLMLQAVVMGLRWHRLTHWLGGELPGALAVRWIFVGLFFNNALPTSVGGDAARVWLLDRRGSAKGVALASVIIERISGVAALAVMVMACLPWVWSRLPPAAGMALAAGSLAVVGLAVASIVADRMVPRRLPGRVAEPLRAVASSGRNIAKRPGALGELAVLGAVAAGLGIGAAYLIGRKLGLAEPYGVFVALVGGAVLLSVLPISIGGWGVREAGMVGLFGGIGADPGLALTLSVAWATLGLLVALPGGVLWLLDRPAATPAPAALPGAGRPG